MQSKTSLFNRGLFKHFSNNIIIFTVINLICTFILIPFSYINRPIEYFDVNLKPEMLGNTTDMSILYFIGMMIYALLCGVMMTYLLKNESASDFFHSLPFKRHTILLHIVIVFLVHLIIVLIINGLITALLMTRYHQITSIAILRWMLLSLVIAASVFFFTLLIGQWINNYINHIVVTSFIIILPAILNSLVHWTYAVLYKGFGVNYYNVYSETNLAQYYFTLPLSVMKQISYNHLNWSYFAVVMLIGLICLALTFISYQLRDNENVKQTYQKYWVELLIGSLLAITGVIFAGWMLSDGKKNFILLTLIYIIAFVVIYFVFQMLNQRSVRIQMNYLSFVIIGLVTTISIVGILSYGKWQEQRIPDINEVKGIDLMVNYPDTYYDSLPGDFQKPITDKGYIKKAMGIQKEILKNGNDKEEGHAFVINYHLKNAKLERSYYGLTDKAVADLRDLNDTNKYGKVLADSYQWDKMKKMTYIDVNTPDNLSSDNNTLKSYKPGKNADLLDAVRKDMSAALYSNPLTLLSGSSSNMSIFTKTADEYSSMQPIEFKVSPYYKNLIQVLIKDKMIMHPNEIFSKGNFYRLTNAKEKSKYEAFNQSSFKKAKPVQVLNDKMRNALDEEHASINGKYPYAYISKSNDEYVLFYMDIDLAH